MFTECARQNNGNESRNVMYPAENVFVVGGCVWPDEADFIQGFDKMEKVGYHILIPDHCWKILATAERGHVAFWIPNTQEARISKRSELGKTGAEEAVEDIAQFVVSVTDLEEKLSSRNLSQTFSLTGNEKAYRPNATQM